MNARHRQTTCRLIIVSGKDTENEPSGGHSTYVRSHARAAQAAGFEPELYCIGHVSESVQVEYGRLRRVQSIPFLQRRRYQRVRSIYALWHSARLYRALLHDLRTETRPVILHGMGIWGMAATRAAATLRRRGGTACSIATIYTCHREEYRCKLQGACRSYGWLQRCHYLLEYVWGRLSLSSGENRMCRTADVLVGNYTSVRRHIERNHGPMPQYRVLPYAAETAFLPELRSTAAPPDVLALEPAAEPLIVSLSRHDPRKGVDVLIQALALLQERGVPFRACIASSGELYRRNRDMARRLQLPPEQVSMPGFVQDPRIYLEAADIYCLPSLEEHSGSVSLLEAMQYGCASVVSDIDGMPEDVDNEQHALLTPPGDANALAAALQRLIEDPALRARLAQGARERFEQRFSAAAVATAMQALYEECLALMQEGA